MIANIEKYFDTVNHDKLISILRERVNDKTTLHLIRAFLKAGVMEDGLVKPNKLGVPKEACTLCVMPMTAISLLRAKSQLTG